MRIIVPIKQVPETHAVRMDEATGTIVREGVESIVNPLDLYAIEAALTLRERLADRGADDPVHVTALSMGPPSADRALHEAISMGVDDAVLLTDKAFAGSDTWATSYALAAAIRRIGTGSCCPQRNEGKPCLSSSSLVVCGERATDGDTGQVGPGIAAFLGAPVLTYVGGIDGVEDRRIRLRRLVEAGHELLEAELPCVLTVVKEIGAPRLPTLRGKQRAKRAEVPRWSAEDLGIDPDKVGLGGSPTRVVKIFRPQVARECELLPAGNDAELTAAAERFAAVAAGQGA